MATMSTKEMRTIAQQPAAGEPIGFLVKQLHQALRRVAEESLGDEQLTLPQLGVLTALQRAPGLSNAELARASFMSPPSMVELLARLEARRLVARRPHPAGGRIMQVQLTPAGTRVLETSKSALSDVEERLLSRLSSNQRQLLRTLLQRCIDSLLDA